MDQDKLACAHCRTRLRPRTNSITVHITMSDGQDYQIWMADLWECPVCRTQIIAGYGANPVSTHLSSSFENYKNAVDITVHGKLIPLS